MERRQLTENAKSGGVGYRNGSSMTEKESKRLRIANDVCYIYFAPVKGKKCQALATNHGLIRIQLL